MHAKPFFFTLTCELSLYSFIIYVVKGSLASAVLAAHLSPTAVLQTCRPDKLCSFHFISGWNRSGSSSNVSGCIAEWNRRGRWKKKCSEVFDWNAKKSCSIEECFAHLELSQIQLFSKLINSIWRTCENNVLVKWDLFWGGECCRKLAMWWKLAPCCKIGGVIDGWMTFSTQHVLYFFLFLRNKHDFCFIQEYKNLFLYFWVYRPLKVQSRTSDDLDELRRHFLTLSLLKMCSLI